jgi:predicted Zn-dependent protease
MKNITIAVVLIGSLTAFAAPASAQLGGLTRGIDKAKGVKDKADKISDLKMSEKDERALGEQVSEKLRQDFGVFQNAEVAKYVTLVGSVLAQGSERPGLKWEFIVLDTDGVNAFAAPGGIVHITRGALGLIKNEAQLAGVLGHEITHVTEKHTVNSIQKGKMVSLGADEVGSSGGLAQSAIAKLAEAAYKNVLNNKFDRDDEIEADSVGIALANKGGYAAGALGDVLARIADRNKDQKEPNGMFATHPQLKERIANIAKVVKEQKLTATATGTARYAKVITFEAKPIGELAVIEGTRGLTGGSATASNDAKKEEPKKEEPKKKGGLLGKVGLTGGSQAQNTQTVASAGARGVGVPDRDAKGGSNPRKLATPVTAAEIDAFRKGIA